jgi:hypothetical protein
MQRGRAFSMFFATLLVAGLAPGNEACSSSEDAPTCKSSDADLRASVPFATGIYGTATSSCAAHCPPTDNTIDCSDEDIVVMDPSRRPIAIHIAAGSYRTELPPGSYTVCPSTGGGSTSLTGCLAFALAAGQLLRIDVTSTRSPGGIYEDIHLQNAAGLPCKTASARSNCASGLVCIPGATPEDGICGPPLIVNEGAACDAADSVNPVRTCAGNLTCEGSICLSTSGPNGPCNDGAHICPETQHCDEPRQTCASPAQAGAWCAETGDCDGNAGFDCLDGAGLRPMPPATATCTAVRSPGAACTDFYQCASLDCVDGHCAPLLTSGQPCMFARQCTSGACHQVCQ